MNPGCYSPWGLLHFFASPATLSADCYQLLAAAQTPPSDPFSATHYAGVFFATCLLEAPIYLWALSDRKRSWRARALGVLLPNLCTHPAIYLLFPLIAVRLQARYVDLLATAEIFAPVVEAAVLIGLWKVKPLRAVAFSTVANLLSWGVGIFLF